MVGWDSLGQTNIINIYCKGVWVGFHDKGWVAQSCLHAGKAVIVIASLSI